MVGEVLILDLELAPDLLVVEVIEGLQILYLFEDFPLNSLDFEELVLLERLGKAFENLLDFAQLFALLEIEDVLDVPLLDVDFVPLLPDVDQELREFHHEFVDSVELGDEVLVLREVGLLLVGKLLLLDFLEHFQELVEALVFPLSKVKRAELFVVVFLDGLCGESLEMALGLALDFLELLFDLLFQLENLFLVNLNFLLGFLLQNVLHLLVFLLADSHYGLPGKLFFFEEVRRLALFLRLLLLFWLRLHSLLPQVLHEELLVVRLGLARGVLLHHVVRCHLHFFLVLAGLLRHKFAYSVGSLILVHYNDFAERLQISCLKSPLGISYSGGTF